MLGDRLRSIRAGLVVSCETAREINETTLAKLLKGPGGMEEFTRVLATFTGGSGAVAMLLTDGSFPGPAGHRLLGAVSETAPEHHALCRWGWQAGPGAPLEPFMSTDYSGMDLDQVAVVSGIGCTGRVAGYLNLDSFHTTHGRPIPFATGLKLANPKLKVVVYSGDGDLSAIGGNHLIHAARRNMDLMVVCVNNYTYGMTGGQVAPTTPLGATVTTMPYGNFEASFNLPHLADACGAVYVARWTIDP